MTRNGRAKIYARPGCATYERQLRARFEPRRASGSPEIVREPRVLYLAS
jgi:hypothetical protein